MNAPEFIEAYMRAVNDGKSIQELADELGVQKQSIYIRASRYRQLGVRVPKPSSLHDGRNIQRLNRIVEKYEKGEQ